MGLSFEEIAGWPPLAWLARCGPDGVEVSGGAMVESDADWAFEGAWAGPVASGDFDRCPIVAGSGVRVRGAEALFVPPTSTVDRLCWMQSAAGRAVVSNSLPAVLAATGAELAEPESYPKAMRSISRGLERCVDSLPTTEGPLRLTYFRNLRWDGATLTPVPKPAVATELASFSVYRGFLAEGFGALAANMADPKRRSLFSFLGTLSSGYDANACTALAREAGCGEAICFETSAMGHADSGVAVAEALGVRPIVIDRGAWREEPADDFLPEVPFLAVGQGGGGLVEFHGAHRHLKNRVLVTGFYGDSIWNPDWRRLGPGIVRKDASGLGLCEYRLWAGFVNCPATFWGSRQVREVVALANADEMRPWRGEGDYQRPVPRRILEEAGVPRDRFGQRKRATPRAAPHRSRRFLRPASQRDYFSWLRRTRENLGRAPRVVSERLDALAWWRNDLAQRAHRRLRSVPGLARSAAWKRRQTRLLARRRKPTRQRRFLIGWALDRAGERYSAAQQRRQAPTIPRRG
jgi:hypothetical protein